MASALLIKHHLDKRTKVKITLKRMAMLTQMKRRLLLQKRNRYMERPPTKWWFSKKTKCYPAWGLHSHAVI